ncbi:MAG: DUF2513 domain-containing protein [Candidatus Poribacteria bacterium]|nr:DUF2513 domain-containing protein [Candidatus Poribacteria bacterium]
MLQTKTELDFELCRKLMLRQEELYDSRTPSLITHFRFEDYSAENISYNVEQLHRAILITNTTPQEWTKGTLSRWPTGNTNIGWKFLEAAKDEARWSEAVESVTTQNESYDLRTLKAVLFAGGS